MGTTRLFLDWMHIDKGTMQAAYDPARLSDDGQATMEHSPSAAAPVSRCHLASIRSRRQNMPTRGAPCGGISLAFIVGSQIMAGMA